MNGKNNQNLRNEHLNSQKIAFTVQFLYKSIVMVLCSARKIFSSVLSYTRNGNIFYIQYSSRKITLLITFVHFLLFFFTQMSTWFKSFRRKGYFFIHVNFPSSKKSTLPSFAQIPYHEPIFIKFTQIVPLYWLTSNKLFVFMFKLHCH